MRPIKNFLYLDEYKMYSISSQIFEGITDYLMDYNASSSSDSETQKGPLASGRVMATILQSESGTHEKKYLHDYAYTLFEDYLHESGKVLSISSENINEALATIDDGGFVRIQAKAIFNDINALKSILQRFNEFGQALAYIGGSEERETVRQQLNTVMNTTKDKNNSARLTQQLKSLENVEKIAQNQGLHQDPTLLKNLSMLLEYGFGDQFEVQMPIESHVFSANLVREYLRERENLLIRKYARFTEKEFVLFGMIAQSSGAAMDSNERNDEPSHLKEAVLHMTEKFAEIEGSFSGRLPNEVIVDPIAVYREILSRPAYAISNSTTIRNLGPRCHTAPPMPAAPRTRSVEEKCAAARVLTPSSWVVGVGRGESGSL